MYFCDKLPVTKCLKTKLCIAKLSFICRQNTGSSLEVGVFLMFESLQKGLVIFDQDHCKDLQQYLASWGKI